MSYNIVLHYKTCHINKFYSSSRTQNLKYFKNQTSLRYVLNIRLSLKIFINFIVSDIGGCWLTDFGLKMKATFQIFSYIEMLNFTMEKRVLFYFKTLLTITDRPPRMFCLRSLSLLSLLI